MDGRESKITRLVFSNESYKATLIKKITKSESIVGTKFTVESKSYIITTGSLKKANKKIDEFKERVRNEYCTQ